MENHNPYQPPSSSSLLETDAGQNNTSLTTLSCVLLPPGISMITYGVCTEIMDKLGVSPSDRAETVIGAIVFTTGAVVSGWCISSRMHNNK